MPVLFILLPITFKQYITKFTKELLEIRLNMLYIIQKEAQGHK